MNALESRAAALAAFRDGDSGNTDLEGCVRAGVCRMAGFVRVAPAPALVARGGLAFAESALDHAELKIPNATLTLGRIPRQRHHPGLQSQHSVTTGATPPSASRTTTSPRATEVTLAVASGTESRIGSPAAAMAVRHLERGILHSRGPTLSAPPWRRLPSRCPEVAAPAHIDVMRRAVAACLHGDVKPSNIGFTAGGSPKLLDFGLARGTGSAAAGGTLRYASPEILSGRPAGEADDVWSLCVVLYEMVSGEHPFDGGSADEVARRIRRRRIARPGAAAGEGPPTPVIAFAAATLRGARSARPATARAFAAALRSAAADGA